MKAIDAIKQIKVMLGVDQAVETPEAETAVVEFAKAMLLDGTEVMVEGDFEEGAQLLVVTEEGDVPAPEGSHETEDGRIITVDAEGKILKVEEKVEDEVEAAEEVEAELETETPAEESSVTLSNEVVSSLVEKLDSLSDSLVELEKRIDSTNEEFHAFKNEPAASKITNNLGATQKATESLAEARFNKLVEFRNETRRNL